MKKHFYSSKGEKVWKNSVLLLKMMDKSVKKIYNKKKHWRD